MIPTRADDEKPYGRVMGWVTAAVSGVAATVGVTTLVFGLQSGASGDGPAEVWIDGPLAEAQLVPGEIVVSAHATADDEIDGLVLSVDGEEVATATDLERSGKLVYGTFDWQATEGEHILVVSQDGGGGAESRERLVYVGTPSDPVPVEKPTPKPSEKPSEKPSPSETPSESATPSETPSTVEPAPEPKPSQKPTEKPPPPLTPPTLGAVTVTPNQVGPNLAACTGDITVRANVVGATSGSALVYRTGLDKDIGGTISGGVFTATFRQAELYGSNTSGPFNVAVTVTNKAGSITRDGSFAVYCSKD